MDTKPMVTVQVPEDLHITLKKIADRRGMKLRALIENALRAFAEKRVA